MGLKERVNKLHDELAAQNEELDRVIEREIERLGVEEAQKVIDDFLREYKSDELRDAVKQT